MIPFNRSVPFIAAVFGVGIILLVMAPSSPSHGALDCQRVMQSPYVNFEMKPGRINYINSRSKASLRQMHAGYQTVGGGWSPIGLTLAELALGLAVSVRSEGLSDGRYCSEIASVDVTLGYDVIDVFIASEYSRGSCQYNAVLDHERLHVGIFQDTLDQYFSRIESTLQRTADTAKPVLSSDPGTATKKLQAILERAVRPLFQEINKSLDRENAAIDTLENYEIEQGNCLTW